MLNDFVYLLVHFDKYLFKPSINFKIILHVFVLLLFYMSNYHLTILHISSSP